VSDQVLAGAEASGPVLADPYVSVLVTPSGRRWQQLWGKAGLEGLVRGGADHGVSSASTNACW